MRWKIVFLILVLAAAGSAVFHCSQVKQGPVPPPGMVPREARIPETAKKVMPEGDAFPPVVHSEAWEQPVRLEGPVNTAGVEDSPFMTPDGETLYFWFTPDMNVPPKKQILDGVTGIYVAKREGEGWSVPERVVLQGPEDLAFDGCPFVLGDRICFCSIRGGNFRTIDMWWAEHRDGRWQGWKNAGKQWNEDFRVGELHITADGRKMVFASDRPGGKGKQDLWITERVGGQWQEPQNLSAVNTEIHEGQPFLTDDGRQLWFTKKSEHLPGTPGIYRSIKTEKGWSKPKEIVSHFAGEPCLDREGNIYFVHPFFSKKGKKLEADIYVARKKKQRAP